MSATNKSDNNGKTKACQIAERLYGMVDEKKVPPEELRELSQNMKQELGAWICNLETLGQLMADASDGKWYCPNGEMLGHFVKNISEHANDLHMTSGFIDDYLKEANHG